MTGHIHIIAYIALILWVPISFVGLSVVRPAFACASLMIGAVMFLPFGVAFDLRGMPPIGKEEVASLGLLLACMVRFPARLARARPGRGLEALVLILILGGVGTALTNGDRLSYGSTVLPALAPYEAVSMGVRDLLRYAIPFFLGRALYRRPADWKDLLLVLAGAGLVYSLFILVELRLSPQLHRWVYGYHPHAFAAHMRWGGYRPMVFMASGLAIALFTANAAIASAALTRARILVFRVSAKWATTYLCVILVLCKSFASMGYALFAIPLVVLSKARFQAQIAAALAMLVFAYPLLRAYDFFPTSALVAVARSINAERADSLQFRFDNEDLLLAKAIQRPLYGWGGFRRARIFDEQRGDTESITDGHWIIVMGNRGLVGYWTIFGLLLFPIFMAARRIDRTPRERDRLILSAIALILALSAVDLLPNGMFTNFIFFVSGCLAGAARWLPASPTSSSLRRLSLRRRRAAINGRRSIGATSRDGFGSRRSPDDTHAVRPLRKATTCLSP